MTNGQKRGLVSRVDASRWSYASSWAARPCILARCAWLGFGFSRGFSCSLCWVGGLAKELFARQPTAVNDPAWACAWRSAHGSLGRGVGCRPWVK